MKNPLGLWAILRTAARAMARKKRAERQRYQPVIIQEDTSLPRRTTKARVRWMATSCKTTKFRMTAGSCRRLRFQHREPGGQRR